MKRMKKFASLLLALVMALALAVPAMAAGNEEGTSIKILVPDMSTHNFVAYQIFKGTQVADTEDAPLADIEWGTGIDGENLLQALRTSTAFGTPNSFANVATAQDVADVLSGEKEDNTALAIAFAKIATDYIIDGKGTPANGGPTANGEYEITGLEQGYYLIVDQTDLGTGTDTVRNASLLQLTKNVVITVKVDVPQVDKDVEEDRDGSTGNAADYDIGDDVPFTFTSAVPNMTQYETYKYIFHDTMDAGLTFNADSVKITIGDGEDAAEVPASSYTVVKNEDGTPLADGCTFEVRFDDLKSVVAEMGKAAGDKVVVSFTAKLNSNAVIGSAGNKNTVILEYSNNPSDYGDGDENTGKTPPSTVIVFTYELNTNKIDGDTEAKLDDAHFRLAKVLEDGSRVWADVVEGEIKWVVAPTEGNDYIEGAVIGKNADNSNITANLYYAGKDFFSKDGKFDIHGLDADTYELWEVQAPAGYNTPKTPFIVVIESVLDQETDPASAASLQELTVKLDNVFSKTKPDEEKGNYNQSGQLPVTIANNQGTILPETGGIGTTIFYVLGGLLTLGAVVLLVTKKRMSLEEK